MMPDKKLKEMQEERKRIYTLHSLGVLLNNVGRTDIKMKKKKPYKVITKMLAKELEAIVSPAQKQLDWDKIKKWAK